MTPFCAEPAGTRVKVSRSLTGDWGALHCDSALRSAQWSMQHLPQVHSMDGVCGVDAVGDEMKCDNWFVHKISLWLYFLQVQTLKMNVAERKVMN